MLLHVLVELSFATKLYWRFYCTMPRDAFAGIIDSILCTNYNAAVIDIGSSTF